MTVPGCGVVRNRSESGVCPDGVNSESGVASEPAEPASLS